MKERNWTNAGLLTVSSYIAAQILADITSLKIALVGSFSIDGGTFIYPFTFTLRDLVHKLLGRGAARTLVMRMPDRRSANRQLIVARSPASVSAAGSLSMNPYFCICGLTLMKTP